MARIITLASQKGGVGKTSMTLALYFAFKELGNLRIAIAETDEQRSIYHFAQETGTKLNLLWGFEPVTFNGFDIILIDTPPKLLGNELKLLVKASDLILMPTKVGIFDVLSTIQTYQDLTERSIGLKIYALLNMVIPQHAINRKVEAHFKRAGVPCFKSQIGNRIAFNHSTYLDGNIFSQKDKKAKEEINKLALEVYGILIGKDL